MQEKFERLSEIKQKELLILMKKEHGNLAAICTVTNLSPNTVKTMAAGMRGKKATVRKLNKIIDNEQR